MFLFASLFSPFLLPLCVHPEILAPAARACMYLYNHNHPFSLHVLPLHMPSMFSLFSSLRDLYVYMMKLEFSV